MRKKWVMTKKLEKTIEQAERDLNKGVNISPAFTNMDDALDWLNAPDSIDNHNNLYK